MRGSEGIPRERNHVHKGTGKCRSLSALSGAVCVCVPGEGSGVTRLTGADSSQWRVLEKHC